MCITQAQLFPRKTMARQIRGFVVPTFWLLKPVCFLRFHFLKLHLLTKIHVLHEVKRNIAFFNTLVWAALAGGTSYFATCQTKYCLFDPFSSLVKFIKNKCFATSQTKYCSFDSPFRFFFSFFFAFGPLVGFLFCNKCNGILRFYDFP